MREVSLFTQVPVDKSQRRVCVAERCGLTEEPSVGIELNANPCRLSRRIDALRGCQLYMDRDCPYPV